MAEVLAGRGQAGPRPSSANRRRLATESVTLAQAAGGAARAGRQGHNGPGSAADTGAYRSDAGAAAAPDGVDNHHILNVALSYGMEDAQQALPPLSSGQAVGRLPGSSHMVSGHAAAERADIGRGTATASSNVRPRAGGLSASAARATGASLSNGERPVAASGLARAALDRLPAPPSAIVPHSRIRATAGGGSSGGLASGAASTAKGTAVNRSGVGRPAGGATVPVGIRPKIRRGGPVAGPGSAAARAAESRAAAAAAAAAATSRNTSSDGDGEGAAEPAARAAGGNPPSHPQRPLNHHLHRGEQHVSQPQPGSPTATAAAASPSSPWSPSPGAPLVPTLSPTSSRPPITPAGNALQTGHDGRLHTALGGGAHTSARPASARPLDSLLDSVHSHSTHAQPGRHERGGAQPNAQHPPRPHQHQHQHAEQHGRRDSDGNPSSSHQPAFVGTQAPLPGIGPLSMFGPLGSPGPLPSAARPPSASSGSATAAVSTATAPAPARRAPPSSAQSNPLGPSPPSQAQPSAEHVASGGGHGVEREASAVAGEGPSSRPASGRATAPAGAPLPRLPSFASRGEAAGASRARHRAPGGAPSTAPRSGAATVPAPAHAPAAAPHPAAGHIARAGSGTVAAHAAASGVDGNAGATATSGPHRPHGPAWNASPTTGRDASAAGSGATSASAVDSRHGLRRASSGGSSGTGVAGSAYSSRADGAGRGGDAASAGRLGLQAADTRGMRAASPHGHAVAESASSRSAGPAGTQPRRRSQSVISIDRRHGGSDSEASGGGGAGGLRGVGLRHPHPHAPNPYLASASGAHSGGSRHGGGGGVAGRTAGAHGGGASRAAAAVAVTRMMFDASPYDSDSGSDENEGYGAVRPPPQRLFRVQQDQNAADRTTFGPARSLGAARAPHPPPAHSYAAVHTHQHLQALRRRQSGDDGVVGGALVLTGGGGGGGGGGAFQERFIGELRRRDAERAALMQLLMPGNEEELLRQAEEEQLALALVLSLQEAESGPAGTAIAVELPARGAATALALHALARGSLLAGIGGLGGGAVVQLEEPPAPTYEELLTLEDVKVPCPQEVLDALPYSTYEGASGATAGACAICQCEYERGEQQVRLPCAHVLHAECARKWLGEYSKKCPICKQAVC